MLEDFRFLHIPRFFGHFFRYSSEQGKMLPVIFGLVIFATFADIFLYILLALVVAEFIMDQGLFQALFSARLPGKILNFKLSF